jgi:hypothetical protein
MKQDDPSPEESKGKRLYLKPYSPAKSLGWTWQAMGAVVGLAGGLVTIVFGSVFSIISWFTKSKSIGSFLGKYGTTLFLLAIPLLILGAHCLDLLDRKR